MSKDLVRTSLDVERHGDSYAPVNVGGSGLTLKQTCLVCCSEVLGLGIWFGVDGYSPYLQFTKLGLLV